MRPLARRRDFVARLAAVPGASALARAVARNIAGRHFVGAMAVVAQTDRQRAEPTVLLARHTFHGDRWGLPGGWVRRREDPAVAAVREVGEEAGIAVRAVEVLGCELHAIDAVPVRYGGITIAYLCLPLEPRSRCLRPHSVEIAETRWMTSDEAAGLVTGFERSMIAKAIEALTLERSEPITRPSR
jgi:8-oxo-dGTP pyrophosphatase MutT (NUDIX family)